MFLLVGLPLTLVGVCLLLAGGGAILVHGKEPPGRDAEAKVTAGFFAMLVGGGAIVGGLQVLVFGL